jgi:hypothetical protein
MVASTIAETRARSNTLVACERGFFADIRRRRCTPVGLEPAENRRCPWPQNPRVAPGLRENTVQISDKNRCKLGSQPWTTARKSSIAVLSPRLTFRRCPSANRSKGFSA